MAIKEMCNNVIRRYGFEAPETIHFFCMVEDKMAIGKLRDLYAKIMF